MIAPEIDEPIWLPVPSAILPVVEQKKMFWSHFLVTEKLYKKFINLPIYPILLEVFATLLLASLTVDIPNPPTVKSNPMIGSYYAI